MKWTVHPLRTWSDPASPQVPDTPIPEEFGGGPLKGGYVDGAYWLRIGGESATEGVEILVGPLRGELVCLALRMSDQKRGLTGSRLKGIPLDDYLEAARTFIAEHCLLAITEEGDFQLPDQSESDSVTVRTTRRGRPMGPDYAQKATDLWWEAKNRGEVDRTKYVATAMAGRSYRQVSRDLNRARKRGLIPPQGPGRPRKAPPPQDVSGV